MPTEGGTWISDLDPSRPVGTVEVVGEGDNHLQLIKAVAKNTLPNANKAFYFPRVTAKSANYIVVAADDHTTFYVNASGGERTISLPTGLSASLTGWRVQVVKSDSTTNGVTIDTVGAETINGGSSVRTETRYGALTFMWTGTEYIMLEGQISDARDALLAGSPADYRAPPPGWPSMIRPIAVTKTGPGGVELNTTPLGAFQLQAGRPFNQTSVVWVDATLGDDANSGTFDSPFQTLIQALEVSTAQFVNVMPGTYYPPDSRIGVDSGASIFKVVRAPYGRVKITITGWPDLQDGVAWILESGNVYRRNLGLTGNAVVHRVIRPATLNRFGFSGSLRKRTSIADLQANFATETYGGWWYDGVSGNLYVTLPTGGDPGTRFRALYTDTVGQARMVLEGARVLFEGPFDFEGISIFATNSGASQAVLMLQGNLQGHQCPVMTYALGLGVEGTGVQFFCSGFVVHASEVDNLNFDPSTGTGTASFVVEHNCISTFAGDVDCFGTGVSANRQGSSFHGGANGLRAASYYAANWGQNIADGGIAATTSYTWMIGCVTEWANQGLSPNFAGIDMSADAAVGAERRCWIDTCRTSKETSDRCIMVSGNEASIWIYNTVLNGGTGSTLNGGTGVIEEYQPDSP